MGPKSQDFWIPRQLGLSGQTWLHSVEPQHRPCHREIKPQLATLNRLNKLDPLESLWHLQLPQVAVSRRPVHDPTIEVACSIESERLVHREDRLALLTGCSKVEMRGVTPLPLRCQKIQKYGRGRQMPSGVSPRFEAEDHTRTIRIVSDLSPST